MGPAQGLYDAPVEKTFQPTGEDSLEVLANHQMTYGLASRLAARAAKKMSNLAASGPAIDADQERFFTRTSAEDFWASEFAKLDRMESENREKLDHYEQQGWVADPTKVPRNLSSLSTVTYNLQWVGDKRAAFRRQHENPNFVADITRHFDIRRECARWAEGLAPAIESLGRRLGDGPPDGLLSKEDNEQFKRLMLRNSFTSRTISWVVGSKDHIVTPLAADASLHLILREALIDRYLQDREGLAAFPENVERLERYMRYAEDVHAAGTAWPDPDRLVLLKLVPDDPMQWGFPGQLIFTIPPDELGQLDFSGVRMHLGT